MKFFFIVLVVLLIPFPAQAQQVPCHLGSWYDTYSQLLAAAQESLPAPEDTDDILADKTITLFVIQFQLEAIMQVSPECSQKLLHQSAYMISLWADWGMLVLLNHGELQFTDEVMQQLAEQYSTAIEDAVLGLQFTTENLYLVESMQ